MVHINAWICIKTLKGSVFFIVSMSTAATMEISHKPASTRNLVHFPSSSMWWKFPSAVHLLFSCKFWKYFCTHDGVLVLEYQIFCFISCKENELSCIFSSVSYQRLVLGLIEFDAQRLFLWRAWAHWCYVHCMSDTDYWGLLKELYEDFWNTSICYFGCSPCKIYLDLRLLPLCKWEFCLCGMLCSIVGG